MGLSLEALEDLSMYYRVKDLFTDVPGLVVVDDYPTTTLVIPTIAVYQGRIRLEDFELGNRVGRRYRKWNIDVYAANKAQRDEFGYRILNGFTNNLLVYDYNAGFPPVSVSVVEVMDVVQRDMEFIKVLPELVDKLYWRSTVFISAVNATV